MLDTMTTGETNQLTRLAAMVQATGYQFVTPTPATHARILARPGREWAHDLRDVFGWSRPFRPGTLPPEIEAAMHDAQVIAPAGQGARSTIRLSTLDTLLFAHSAYPTTAPDSVFFGPDTYRFARAIAALPPKPVTRAVDIGCGAGPGAILLARAHPHAEIHAADINPRALALTRANAALARTRVHATESDLLTAIPGPFDLIVANPPYMADPARRAYRDGGGPLGDALSLKILETAIDRLAPGGTLLLYTGAAVVNGRSPFHDAAAARLQGTNLDWQFQEVDPDVFNEELDEPAYANAERIAAVTLTAHKPG